MEGCRNVLGLLGNDEIVALCDTITNRLVQPEGHQEAIRAVSVYKVQKNFGGHAKDYWKKQSQLKLKEMLEPVKTEDVRLFEQQEKEDKKAEKFDFRRLGEEFWHWFFELLNSQNAILGPPQEEWGATALLA
ncbi:Uncharacterized protein C3orf38, partial [Eschrichtius robustus]|nr:Uncharacterized protein C3orf38 [Eschrichtius robustus]